MIAYLDSSALTAWFDPGNPHCLRVLAWREKVAPVEFVLNQLLRWECGHYFRHARGDHADVARQAYRQAEAARRFRLQSINPLSAMQAADKFSHAHGDSVECGFWDLCHVMAARRDRLPFVTADRRQRGAAALAGLDVVYVGPPA